MTKPNQPERMTVVRVLVYDGPREWVERALEMSATGPDRPVGGLPPDRSILEVARTTITGDERLVALIHPKAL